MSATCRTVPDPPSSPHNRPHDCDWCAFNEPAQSADFEIYSEHRDDSFSRICASCAVNLVKSVSAMVMMGDHKKAAKELKAFFKGPAK